MCVRVPAIRARPSNRAGLAKSRPCAFSARHSPHLGEGKETGPPQARPKSGAGTALASRPCRDLPSMLGHDEPRLAAKPEPMTDLAATLHAVSAPAIEKAPLERYVPPAKPSLVGLSRAELAEAIGRIGLPPAQRKMRVQQIWHWLYVRGATRFEQMSNVSKDLHAVLEAHFTLARPEVVAEQVSADGTRKWLLRLPGEIAGERPHEVECVYIPEAGRATLCVSSQVGCTLTCSFCHTGTQRLVRNLTPGEIVGQVMVARDRLGDWPGGTPPQGAIVPTDGGRFVTNIVMMGMGEPLYNFEAVRDALLVV